jgi:hypothetical protein
MILDKYYKDLIDQITNATSDREQLFIIECLTLSLRDWQSPYFSEGSVEELYYNNLNKILDIIKETLEKEKEINEKNKGTI